MNGIQSLLPGQGGAPQGPMPGQAQAPGQAPPPGATPMPGMQPPQGGPQQGIQSLTPALSQMGIEQLQAELMNPGSQIPKFALLSTIDRKIKERQAMQAAQGQAAMQQNAQQPPGSVAEQILAAAQQMQPPVQARYGGVMRGYAGGGVVAFADGPGEQGVRGTPAKASPVGPFPGWQNPDIDEDGNPRSQSARKAIMDYNDRLAAAYARSQTAKRAAEAPTPRPLSSLAAPSGVPIEAIRRLQEFPPMGRGPGGSASIDIPSPPSAAPTDFSGGPEPGGVNPPFRAAPQTVPPPQPRPQPRPPGPRPAPGAAAAQPSAAQPAATAQPAPTIDPFYDRFFKQQEAEMESRKRELAGFKKQQLDVLGLMESKEKRRADELAGRRSQAEKEREDALRRTIGYTAEDFFRAAALLGGAKKGEVMSRLGAAFQTAEARKRTEKEAARERFAKFETEERAERVVLDQMEITRRERDVAIMSGRMDKANALNDKLSDLALSLQKTREDLTQRDIENLREGRKVSALESQARTQAAGIKRPGETERIIAELRRENPKLSYSDALKALYGMKQEPRSEAELRKEWSSNLILQQQYPNFADYVKAVTLPTGGVAGDYGTPPPNAVRPKGQP